MLSDRSEEFEILLTEWKTATEMHNYYGTITWQIASIIVAGVIISTTLLTDIKVTMIPTLIIGIGSLLLTVVLYAFHVRNRDLGTCHVNRAKQIETYLHEHYFTDPSAPATVRKSPRIWTDVEEHGPSSFLGLHFTGHHLFEWLIIGLFFVISFVMLWKYCLMTLTLSLGYDITNLQSLAFSLVFAVGFAVFLHLSSKPSLEILAANDEHAPGHPIKYVHVIVRNKDRRFLFRQTAVNCNSEVTFTEASSGRSFGPFRTKWASRPNPVVPTIDPSSHKAVLLPDETKIDQAGHEDIPSGSGRGLDIAVKIEGDTQCYAHSPENFFDPNYRPQTHRLDGTKYSVMVVVRSENKAKAQRAFMLSNIGCSASDLSLASG